MNGHDFYRAKAAAGVCGLTPDSAELTRINQYTLRECAADELFVFRATACDNEIDRDKEAFTIPALEKLAGMFVGRTVLAEPHRPAVENQCARIYAAEVEKERGKTTSYGAPYAKLVVKCYIPRTEGLAPLIEMIETGIRKELSVGCRVGKNTCSICDKPYWSNECEHRIGMEYENGKKCFIRLDEPQDAYEISFAAIPAQRAAGVTKEAGIFGEAPYLAELHSIIGALKDVAKTLRAAPAAATPPAQEGKPGGIAPNDDFGELIRNAQALYTKIFNEEGK